MRLEIKRQTYAGHLGQVLDDGLARTRPRNGINYAAIEHVSVQIENSCGCSP